MTDELWTRSARELARLIATKEVSSTEVLDAHLDRIASVNPQLNAVVRILDAEARAAAKEADRVVAAGEPMGPLHGVPISVKDNIDVVGDVSTQGIPMLAEIPATADAPAVERMRAAGAIPFARTNMPELGLRVHTHSATYGLTRNPWDSERTAAGSSGGEASAIAAGMSPLGLGNDIGGSLRNPAYACGIASIKPSTQRVAYATTTMPGTPLLAEQLMLVQGVLGRHVADVRLGFEIIAGADPRDPYVIDAPFDGPAGPQRAALVPEPAGGSTDPAIAAAVRAAGQVLVDAGWEVEEVAPPQLEHAYLAWAMHMNADLHALKPLLELALTDESMSFIRHGETAFGEVDMASINAAHQLRLEVATAWAIFMERYPVIIGPTWTQKPFHHGFDIIDYASAEAVLEMMRFILPQNVLGIPSVCVPTGVADAMPTGVQVTARRFREDECLAVAEMIEDAMGVLTPIDPR
jgi:amidase